MRTLWYYTKNLYFKMVKDNALFLASGVAFNLLVSAIPLMLIIFSIGGFVFHTSSELWDKTVLYIQGLIPVSSERIINNTQALIRDRAWLGILGVVGVAFTATRLFATLRTVLDVVFEADRTRGVLHGKAFDFAMLFLLGLVLILSNLLLTFIPGLARMNQVFSGNLPTVEAFLGSGPVTVFGTFCLTLVLLFFTYRLFPSRKVSTGTSWTASLIASSVIELTKHAYRYYIGLYPGINRVYGTLGAILALIFWFYLTALVYVMAAEVALIRHRRREAMSLAPTDQV
ncbi:YihY/virulence factor BrkB family protein [bacterium]|nr:YihY/virulence factor BrkB family protein [bacterium]